MADLNVMQPNRLENALIEKSLKTVPSGEQSGAMVGSSRKSDLSNSGNIRQVSPAVVPQPSSKQVINQSPNATSNEGVDQLVKSLNAKLEKLQNYLRFEKDEGSERMVIFIKNSKTDEVIRQIPSQEFLTISENITKFLEMSQPLSKKMAIPTGLITNERA